MLQAMTSSWSDGTAGPIAFCIPDGRMPQELITKFNMDNVGESFVFTSGSSSHFMTADTLDQVFEQLFSPALAKQRKR